MQKFLLPFFILSLASCSTFLTGAKQQIVVRSNINGAEVFLNGEKACETPCTLTVKKRKKAYPITLKAEGWKDVTVELHSAVNTMLTSNSSNLSVGSLTDLTTGAFWAYNQDTLYIVLSPVKGTRKKEKINGSGVAKICFFQLFSHSVRSFGQARKRRIFHDLVEKDGASRRKNLGDFETIKNRRRFFRRNRRKI